MMKNIKTIILVMAGILSVLVSVMGVLGASVSLSLGGYNTEIYTQESVNVPVTVTATNITGNVDVILSPKSGLGCSTCTLSATGFTGTTNEQKPVTFSLTGTQTGSYNPPFISISGSSGSTEATPLTSGTQISVVEAPTWVTSWTASNETPAAGDEVTLTLAITPSGTFGGVVANLTLTGGLSLVSGTNPRSIGTISGASNTQWVVQVDDDGTATVAVSSTSPYESYDDNTRTITYTFEAAGGNNNNRRGGGSGGGGGGSGETSSFASAQQLALGYTKSVIIGDTIKFPIGTQNHTLKVNNVNGTLKKIDITINSTPQTAVLGEGESKSFDVTGDGVMDVEVKVLSIGMTIANLLITSVQTTPTSPQGSGGTSTAPGTGAAVAPGTSTGGEPAATTSAGAQSEGNGILIWGLVIAVLVVMAAVVLVVVYRRRNNADFKSILSA